MAEEKERIVPPPALWTRCAGLFFFLVDSIGTLPLEKVIPWIIRIYQSPYFFYGCYPVTIAIATFAFMTAFRGSASRRDRLFAIFNLAWVLFATFAYLFSLSFPGVDDPNGGLQISSTVVRTAMKC